MATKTRRTNTESRIMNSASTLFHERGLRGVGVDDVIGESGVSRSTLYAHFRSKGDLVVAFLRQADDSWMGHLDAAAERAGSDPAAQLVGAFDALLDAFDRHGFFGCPFVSAAVETTLDSDARAVTIAHVERRQAWLGELAGRAGAADPERLSGHLGLLIDGALVAGRLQQDRGVVEVAKDAARAAVAAQCPASDGAGQDQGGDRR